MDAPQEEFYSKPETEAAWERFKRIPIPTVQTDTDPA
jgi:hypothetical protein